MKKLIYEKLFENIKRLNWRLEKNYQDEYLIRFRPNLSAIDPIQEIEVPITSMPNRNVNCIIVIPTLLYIR